MKKQELYNALKSKFDKVQPVAKWLLKEEPVEGVKRYTVRVYSNSGGLRSFHPYVVDEGTAKETVSFGNDLSPTEDVVPSAGDVAKANFQKALAKLRTANSLVELGVIDKSNEIYTDIVTYLQNNISTNIL